MTLEQGQKGFDGEPRRPKYPREFVERYGAKAGLLLYVAREFPDIPQMPMVVTEPGEPNADFLRRADDAGIGWPRFFRSSAVAELDGYEGDFPTEEVEAFEVGHERVRSNPQNYSLFRNHEYFDNYINDLLNGIRVSPQRIKAEGEGWDLPDEINIIIAERSPSRYFGTYFKHPNRDGYFLMALTDAETQHFTRESDKTGLKGDFEYSPEKGVARLETYPKGHGIDYKNTMEKDLIDVATWHDRIANLPEMDRNWSYQLEFGIDPVRLYQVRPFKQVEKAVFKVEDPLEFNPEALVIGITPPDGLTLRVETDLWNRFVDNKPINPDRRPSLLYSDLRDSRDVGFLRNHRASILYDSFGLLQHGDIKGMRRANVSVLLSPQISDRPHFEQGDWVNIKSDGYKFKAEKIS